MPIDKQKSGKEHLVSNKGHLLGIRLIDVDLAKKHYTYWEGIDAIIRAYAQINPQEMAETIASNKMKRDQAAFATGGGKSRAFRQTISLPMGLTLYLEDYDKTLFSNKKTLHQFMRHFPGFRTCNTV